jgi:hypothetical protein
MRAPPLVLGLALALALAAAGTVRAQEPAAVSITSPAAGEMLRGQVFVRGTTAVPGFIASELAFSYSGDLTGTWFVIQASAQPVTNDILATWDTQSITDGDYILRLRVTLQDGTLQETLVAGLQVMNYTALPTPTSAPTATATPGSAPPTPMLIPPSPTATQPPPATPTPLPPNPAALTTAAIYSSLGRGALLIILLFVSFGILLRLRHP